jgi:hypothetical protein
MPFALSPVLVLALGALGSVAVARWVAREAKRVNAVLHPHPADRAAEPQEAPVTRLRRDPASGVYRPE